MVSGHGEELGPKIPRTIPEEELTNNLMETSSEILRGSDGEGFPLQGGRRQLQGLTQHGRI